MKKHIYTTQSEFIKAYEGIEDSRVEGIKQYKLTSVYAEVLDRKFLDRFNPQKTCIAVCSYKGVTYDKDELIKNAIEKVESLKHYHTSTKFGINENVGEYSLYEYLELEGFMLYRYSFNLEDGNDNPEYYLDLTYTPEYHPHLVRENVYYYGKKL